jgi:alpha-D-ribose 1-methylphosphonate 5-triphosphate synthase subunit PhnH
MSLDLPGFGDPVGDAQSCFRAVLGAMSRPGRIGRAGMGLIPPPGLAAATAAVALTLLDAETGVFLDPGFAGASEWIGFHCGAPPASLAAADFLIVGNLPDLASVYAGSDEAPENSATIVLQVASLRRGPGYRLAGPGLESFSILHIDGVPKNFVAQWHANHALFPRGIDIILCAGDELAALPRSIQIEEA